MVRLHPPRPIDTRDKRRLCLFCIACDSLHGIQDEFCYFRSGGILRANNNYARVVFLDGLDFCSSVPDIFVFGYRNPVSLADQFYPVFVRCVYRQMIVMDFDFDARITKSVGDDMFAQVSIQIEDDFFKQPPGVHSGLLPRFPLLCVHNPESTPQPTRRPCIAQR